MAEGSASYSGQRKAFTKIACSLNDFWGRAEITTQVLSECGWERSPAPKERALRTLDTLSLIVIPPFCHDTHQTESCKQHGVSLRLRDCGNLC